MLRFPGRVVPGFQAGQGESGLPGCLPGLLQLGRGGVFLPVRQEEDNPAAVPGGGADIGAAALAAENHSLVLQHGQGRADGLAAAPIPGAELGLGGQPVPELAAADIQLQLLGDALIFGMHGRSSFVYYLSFWAVSVIKIRQIP